MTPDTVIDRHSREAERVTDALRRRAARLVLSADTLTHAHALAEAAGWREADVVDRLRKEWLNDLMADVTGDEYGRAAVAPDRHFLRWIEERLDSPFHVTWRAVEKAGRLHGSGVAVMMVSARWPQEIAWAQRMRCVPDDGSAVLAALFVADARRDPAKAFLALTGQYVRAVAEDRNYARHPNHELAPERIRSGDGDSDWTPLFLHHARRAFAPILGQLSPQKMKALAAKARHDEAQDVRRERTARALEYVARWRLAHRCTVLHAASGAGMEANDVVAAEEAFVAGLSEGRIELDGERPVDAVFADWMRAADWLPDRVDAEERERRLDAVRLIGPRWVERLPPDILDLGAASRAAFARWRAAVLTGVRPAPRDPVADYAMWFLTEAAG